MCLPCRNHVAHWLETGEEVGENRPHILTSARHLSWAVRSSWTRAHSNHYLPLFYSLALKNINWQLLLLFFSTSHMHSDCFVFIFIQMWPFRILTLDLGEKYCSVSSFAKRLKVWKWWERLSEWVGLLITNKYSSYTEIQANRRTIWTFCGPTHISVIPYYLLPASWSKRKLNCSSALLLL